MWISTFFLSNQSQDTFLTPIFQITEIFDPIMVDTNTDSRFFLTEMSPHVFLGPGWCYRLISFSLGSIAIFSKKERH